MSAHPVAPGHPILHWVVSRSVYYHLLFSDPVAIQERSGSDNAKQVPDQAGRTTAQVSPRAHRTVPGACRIYQRYHICPSEGLLSTSRPAPPPAPSIAFSSSAASQCMPWCNLSHFVGSVRDFRKNIYAFPAHRLPLRPYPFTPPPPPRLSSLAQHCHCYSLPLEPGVILDSSH